MRADFNRNKLQIRNISLPFPAPSITLPTFRSRNRWLHTSPIPSNNRRNRNPRYFTRSIIKPLANPLIIRWFRSTNNLRNKTLATVPLPKRRLKTLQSRPSQWANNSEISTFMAIRTRLVSVFRTWWLNSSPIRILGWIVHSTTFLV
jgi:hypothetical protein